MTDLLSLEWVIRAGRSAARARVLATAVMLMVSTGTIGKADELSLCPRPGESLAHLPGDDRASAASEQAVLEKKYHSANLETYASGEWKQYEEAGDSKTEDEEDEDKSLWAFKGALLPGWRTRLLRPFSISLSRIDQLDRIFDGEIDPITEEPTFVDNPAPDLDKRSVTIHPGRFFRTTAELKAAYGVATGKATRSWIDIGSDPLRKIPTDEKLAELASANTKGYTKRILSAFKMTFGHSERSPLSVFGSSDFDSSVFDSDDGEFVYEVSLELDKLVLFPSQMLEAYETLELHLKLDPLQKVTLKSIENAGCGKVDPVECLRRVSDLPVRRGWLAGVLPKIKVESKDQFDFVLAGGQAFPFQEGSLETVTVAWDLMTVLDSAKQRRDAIKALAAHDKIQKREALRGREPVMPRSEIRLPQGFPLPVQLRSCFRKEPDEKEECVVPPDVKWFLQNDGSPVEVAENGQLSVEGAGPGEYQLHLCLVDGFANYSERPQKLTVLVAE